MRCRISGFHARLEARGFLRRGWRGLARERRPDDAAILVELHAQTQAHLGQDFLDLVERLAAEIFRLQHLVLALLDQFADGLDIRVLQAIVRTDGEFEFLYGTVQVLDARVIVRLDRFLGQVRLFLEVDEDAHVVLDELRGQADGILRSNRTIGPDFQRQLFVVRHLSETRCLHGIIDLAHGRVDGIHGDVPDGQILVEIAVGRDIPAAVLNAHFELKLSAFVDRGDVHGLVQHREIGVFLNHRGGYDAGILDVDEDRLRLVVIELERHLFQVEDNVGGILYHAGNRREFVQDAFDFYGCDGRALNRAKQSPAESVPNRGAPAALKWLCRKFPKLICKRLKFGRQAFRFLKTFPHLLSPSSPRSRGNKSGSRI